MTTEIVKVVVKPWYESRTLWANTVGFIAVGVQIYTGFVVPAEYQALALTIINLGLRFITRGPVVADIPPDVELKIERQ